MSYYARRAICYISDICMPYILVSAAWVLFKELLCLILVFVCNFLPPMPLALTSPMTRRGLKAFVRLLYLLLVHIPHSGFLKYHESLISDGSAILTVSELPLTTLMLQSP